MVWSAGQREFVPLLLGLYWFASPTKVKRRGGIRWVMIEEMEMGLHPKGIEVMLFIILDLLWRGYRVCLSTHSPHVLDSSGLSVSSENIRPIQGSPKDVCVAANAETLKVAKSALE